MKMYENPRLSWPREYNRVTGLALSRISGDFQIRVLACKNSNTNWLTILIEFEYLQWNQRSYAYVQDKIVKKNK